jgi:hypothetical protein
MHEGRPLPNLISTTTDVTSPLARTHEARELLCLRVELRQTGIVLGRQTQSWQESVVTDDGEWNRAARRTVHRPSTVVQLCTPLDCR